MLKTGRPITEHCCSNIEVLKSAAQPFQEILFQHGKFRLEKNSVRNDFNLIFEQFHLT